MQTPFKAVLSMVVSRQLAQQACHVVQGLSNIPSHCGQLMLLTASIQHIPSSSFQHAPDLCCHAIMEHLS